MQSRLLGLVLLAFFVTPEVSAQGEINEAPSIFYRNERTYGGSLLSNGWAIDAQWAKRKDAFNSFTYGANIGYIKHPKEFKSQSPYTGGWGRSYVFGKMNEAIVLRGSAGYQNEIFGKFDQGGIAIRHFYSGGLSLVLLKPIYYLKVVGYDVAQQDVIRKESKFDPDYMQSIYDIYDRMSFFTGINETRIVPGLFLRTGLSFEYSSVDQVINALEGGIQVESFLKKLPIMASDDNRLLFFSLFLTYRFGKVTDARYQ